MAKTPLTSETRVNTSSAVTQRIKSFSVGSEGLRIELKGAKNQNRVFVAKSDGVAFRALVSAAILAHSTGEKITIQYPLAVSLGQGQNISISAIGFGDGPDFAG